MSNRIVVVEGLIYTDRGIVSINKSIIKLQGIRSEMLGMPVLALLRRSDTGLSYLEGYGG